MADADQSLKILIELGVINQKDLEAANQLLSESVRIGRNLGDTLPESWQKQKNFNDAVGAGGNAAEEYARKAEGMRRVVGELNRVVPGLGEAFHAIEKTIEGEGATLIMVALAIQAATTWWEFYKEKAEAAAEGQAKALDKVRDSTREALNEQRDYNKEMAAASVSQDKFADALGRANTVLDAMLRAKRALLKVDEDAELAKANTPEEKDAIRKKYADKGADVDSAEEKSKLELLNNVIASLKADEGQAQAERNKLIDEIGKAVHDGKLDLIPDLNAKVKELHERIVSDQRKVTDYSNQARTAADVHSINDGSRAAAGNREISKGVEGIDAVAHGEKLSQEQIKANAALTQLFAAHSGGIQQMQAIIKYHLAHSTTQAQEITALKNALATLQGQMRNASNGTR